MNIPNECQCDECRKRHHDHDKYHGQKNDHYHDDCKCQKNEHRLDKCHCQKNDHYHDDCKCQKNEHRLDKCHCQNNHHCRERNFKECCHQEKHHDCFENRCFCDDHFSVRLAGLTSGMAFRLRQLIDCDIKIIVADENETIQGKLVIVGKDFVEVLVKNVRKEKGKKGKKDCRCKMQSRIIPFESIKFIENLD